MMTKLIAILAILIVLYGGWKLFEYWETVKANEEKAKVEETIRPEQLPGLSSPFEASLATAYTQGAVGLSKWLERYRTNVQDPRLAWIELDYVVLITKDNPVQAKKVFAQIKNRMKPDWPVQVQKRVRSLAKTYD
jgi:hypothetical protein